jgi:galactitol-specific phosphotransferase system IIB component
MMLLKKIRNSCTILALAGLGLGVGTPCFSKDKEVKDVSKEQKISVDKTVYDFGTVSSTGETVKAIFVITNHTEESITLAEVKASCGCTTPSWTKTPIEPGQTGEVVAAYNPKGYSGSFEKTLTIRATEIPEVVKVTIKGTVE